ncbi:ABC transporter permease [Archaeoglobus veneficus]|uniref:Uncharacterized protein n=1 Tax=Archaeoglobus veneficus (strain DSM 11195 / SNP6) TaxID=693661 RepID=F2KNY2_ARCVS|nr:ABC transporter permease [Archaeoglobus veneficus]AEA46290.1 hypothetical protein Arcve_0253 [Archaeoglobus veneficus SNP6]
MNIVNTLITMEKLKDDVFSFKLFFLICLIGTSSLISWGISETVFILAKDSTVFALISALTSIVLFAPMAGILLGSDTFTGSSREILLSCVSRKTYLLSRWVAAYLLLATGIVLSIAIPVFISYMRFHGVEFNINFLFAVVCFLLFSLVFVSASTCFSVLTNSTMASLILTGIYTTIEAGVGVIGYVYQNKLLYYFSPHALVIKGVLPEHGQIAMQLTSIAVLLFYSIVFLWFATHYGGRRDV